jgi:phosphoglycolate phosphatase
VNKQKPTIIFDFDGTLADTVKILLKIYNELAHLQGFRLVEEKDWLELRKGTIKNGFKWTGIRPYQAPGMLSQGLKMMEAYTKDVKLFPKMVRVIEHFSERGYDLFVLSTNSEKVIKQVLKQNGLSQDLTVLKSSKVFGKARSIRRLLRQHGYNKETVWMIGDEVRDMTAARRTGINGIAVTWGLQPESSLKKVPGIFIVHKPSQILKIIEENNA